MRIPKKNKVYVKFRNGNRVVETYVENNKERKDLFELIKEEVFGKKDKDSKIGFKAEEKK